MTNKPDGGPAFPPTELLWNPSLNRWESREPSGMSLRDWFAGQALAGILANSALEVVTSREYASNAFLYADAMLKARER